MSYSVSAVGATKAAALEELGKQLDAVVDGQPIHKADIEHAKTAAAAFVGVMAEPKEGQQIGISANGSISWNSPTSDAAQDEFTGLHFSVSVGYV